MSECYALFIGDAALFDQVPIISWVVEGSGETGGDFVNIVFTIAVLSMCGVDPSYLCHALRPNRFAVHVCVKGLEMGKYSTFQFACQDGTTDSNNDLDSVESVSLVPGRKGNAIEKCTEIDGSDREL